jgi:hypothetical protein
MRRKAPTEVLMGIAVSRRSGASVRLAVCVTTPKPHASSPASLAGVRPKPHVASVRRLTSTSELVATEAIEIEVADGQPYSFAELQARVAEIGASLSEAGILAKVALRVELEGALEVTVFPSEDDDRIVEDAKARIPDHLRPRGTAQIRPVVDT